MTSSRFFTIALALVIVLIVVVFIPRLTDFFARDDFAGLKVEANSLTDFGSFFKPDPSGARPWYRPFSFQVRFWLMREAFGFNPLPYHLLILILHCANVILCFHFLRSLTRRGDIALLAATLYGLSGAHYISLTWFSAGVEMLTAFVYLWGLILFVSWRRHPSFFRGLSICLLFILMLLSKEAAVTFPFALLLTDVFLPDVEAGVGRLKAARIKLYGSLFIILTAYAVFWFTWQYLPSAGKPGAYDTTFNPLIWLVNFAAYFVQSFVGTSILIALASATGISVASTGMRGILTDRMVVIFLLLAVVVACIGFALLRKYWRNASAEYRKLIAWGILWFVLCLLPVLHFADHMNAYFLNIPLIGMTAAVASLAISLGMNSPTRGKLRLLGWILLALYAANFIVNAQLGPQYRALSIMSRIAGRAYSRMNAMNPSFEPGTALFILDVDKKFRNAVEYGRMYEVCYAGSIERCLVFAKGIKVTREELVSEGWNDDLPKRFYIYDGDDYIAADEAYFLERYVYRDFP